MIVEVEPGRVCVRSPDAPGDEWIDVPADIFARGQPTLGQDYLVRYEDGYVSWSPKDPFEEGYSEVKG